jgi:hypothetical protein
MQWDKQAYNPVEINGLPLPTGTVLLAEKVSRLPRRIGGTN